MMSETNSVERSVMPWEKCKEHGPAAAGVWACPTCLVELRTENERLRAALADSCEEHRAEIYDTTTGGGCMLLHDALAAERERCAKVCRDKAAGWLKRADAGDMQRDTARHAEIAAGQIEAAILRAERRSNRPWPQQEQR